MNKLFPVVPEDRKEASLDSVKDGLYAIGIK